MADELLVATPDVQDDAALAGASAPDEIEVEVVDEVPESEKPRLKDPANYKPYDSETDPKFKDLSEDTQRRINRLTFEREEFRRLQQQTQRERDALQQWAQSMVERDGQFRKITAATQKTAIQAHVAQADAEMKQVREDLRSAIELGNTEKHLEAQERLAATMAKRQSLLAMPEPSEAQIPAAPAVPVPPRQEANLDERAARWAQQNPWFQAQAGPNGAVGKNPMSAYALAVHQHLIAQGLQPNSEQYYASLDAETKKRFPEAFAQEQATEPAAQPARPAAKKTASIVAPSVRVGVNGKRTVRLSAEQAATADRLGVPRDAYARTLLGDKFANA